MEGEDSALSVLYEPGGGQAGHRAVAHSGGKLAHLLGPAVPGHKDAGEAGAAVLTGAEIALLVQLQLSPEGGGAGDPPHGGEHPV